MLGSVVLAVFALSLPRSAAWPVCEPSFPTARSSPGRPSAAHADAVETLALPSLRVRGVSRRAVVGQLVSGTGAGWWGLRRPAHDGHPRRARGDVGDPLVRHRPLLSAALAVDPRRPGLAGALPRAWPTPSRGYALVMRDHLPAGMAGPARGSFFAAYMSTVSTQLNWGTSYLVNDVYGRFVRPEAGERELVRRLARHDPAAHGAQRGGHLLPGECPAGLGVRPRVRGRRGTGHDPPGGTGGGSTRYPRSPRSWPRPSASSSCGRSATSRFRSRSCIWFPGPPHGGSSPHGSPRRSPCPTSPPSTAASGRAAPDGVHVRPVASGVARRAHPSSRPALAWLAGCLLVYGVLFGVSGLLFDRGHVAPWCRSWSRRGPRLWLARRRPLERDRRLRGRQRQSDVAVGGGDPPSPNRPRPCARRRAPDPATGPQRANHRPAWGTAGVSVGA